MCGRHEERNEEEYNKDEKGENQQRK